MLLLTVSTDAVFRARALGNQSQPCYKRIPITTELSKLFFRNKFHRSNMHAALFIYPRPFLEFTGRKRQALHVQGTLKGLT